MSIKKGTRVKLSTKPEWGLGEVIEDSSSVSIRVFFVGAGLKQFSPQHAKLEVVSGPSANSAILDNLSAKSLQPNARYLSVPHAIERFLELFPKGFYGEEYKEQERDYKAKASKLAQELLNAKNLARQIRNGAHEEICRDALRVMNATNLVFPNEKMDLKDGLVSKGAQKRFAESLEQLLQRAVPNEAAFKSFFKVLQDIGAAKWTCATYFPFLVFPDVHMFVKPMVTQKAAELSAFDLNYKPELNWLTYARVLEFANRLRGDLGELKPRDMIDVQSFMWCIAPEM